MFDLDTKYGKAKIYAETLENEAMSQIVQIANSPLGENANIRIMPDAHAGAGCVIGFTAKLNNRVCPNVIGVDIGCGMRVVQIGNVEIDFDKLDTVIRENIPMGHNVGIRRYFDYEELLCFNHLKNLRHIECSLGTLGGGNHFIEIDSDEEGNKYLVIHTGSRNLGKQVADFYQKRAEEQCFRGDEKELNEKIRTVIEAYKILGKQKEISDAINTVKNEYKEKVPFIPKDLAYLEGELLEAYLHDMKICQEWAELNRRIIATKICSEMGWNYSNMWESVHNYISFEDGIMRKGSISAYENERVIIPLNMRDGCIIGVGKENADWNYSAPHGAGRIMSRSAAKQQVNLEDFKETMKGIYSSSICEATLDESPFAYKPSEEIINAVKETVEILKIVKPIYNIKASD